MIEASTLSMFLLAVLALFVAPGPNMAFLVSHGIAHGPRGGIAAAAGFATADLVHTLAAATGITALVAAWPAAFDLIRYAGAIYLVWLAIQAVRTGGGIAISHLPRTPTLRIAWMALVSNLLNPKTLFFFIVFFPQFVDPARGDITLQILMLGAVFATTMVMLNSLLGVFSGQVGRWLGRSRLAARYQGWFLGGVLAALALRLLLLERPAPR